MDSNDKMDRRISNKTIVALIVVTAGLMRWHHGELRVYNCCLVIDLLDFAVDTAICFFPCVLFGSSSIRISYGMLNLMVASAIPNEYSIWLRYLPTLTSVVLLEVLSRILARWSLQHTESSSHKGD
jgi:hypothetical protein